MTVRGERVMHKNMGTNIPILAGQLFEPVNKFELTEKITMEIKNAIEIYLPFINIQNINVFTHDDDESIELNQVRVSMSYIIQDQQAMLDHMTFTVTSV